MRGRKPDLKVVRSGDGAAKPKAKRARVPAPPAHLSAAAKREWKRIAPELHSAGLLTVRDRSALAMLCEAYGVWERATVAMAQKDYLIILKASGNAAPDPLLHVARGALADYARLANEFGLTPLSRGRVPGTPPKQSANPYLDDAAA